MTQIITIAICLFIVSNSLYSQDCTDKLLLDGTMTVVQAEIDTTGHWWAIARQTEGLNVLIVDGIHYGPFERITLPKISFDGSAWAAGVQILGRWNILTRDGFQDLDGDVLQYVFFPSQSSVLWWYQRNGDDRKIANSERYFSCVTEPKQVSADATGANVAWTEHRNSRQILMLNGRDVAVAEDIKLAGLNAAGDPVYATRNGPRWTVYFGDREIAGSISTISSITLNATGTFVSWTGTDGSGAGRIAVYSEDMFEPWLSKPLEAVYGIVGAPFDPMVSAITVRNGRRVVNYMGAEYPAGVETGPLAFSHDGAVLAFAGLDGDFFVSINGKRNIIRGAASLESPLAIATDGASVGWASVTTLAYVNLEFNVLRLGRMCDQMGNVIYDRRTRSYKGLGYVTGRLYMLECKP